MNTAPGRTAGIRLIGSLISPALAALCLMPLGCKSSDSDVERSLVGVVERIDFGGPTSYVTCGKVYVGADPDAEQVELAARRGVEVLICVGPVGTGLDGSALDRARWLELEVEQVRFDGARPTDLDIERALELLEAPRDGRILLHSPQGGWAAGLLAILRVERMGIDPSDALAEARHAGLEPGPQEDFMIERLGLGTFAH